MGLLSVSSVLSVVGSVVLAILILLIMITVHEFGHYLAGKALKFKINEFAIGFGPKLFKRKSKKTGELFSVRLLPLGGFCAFDGEDGANGEEENKDSFTAKAPWKRIIVLLAGPLMNYVLALLLIIASMFAFGQQVFKVGSVDTGAENAAVYEGHSLEANDLILEVNGKRVYLITDMMYGFKGQDRGRSGADSRFPRRGRGDGGRNVAFGLQLRKLVGYKQALARARRWYGNKRRRQVLGRCGGQLPLGLFSDDRLVFRVFVQNSGYYLQSARRTSDGKSGFKRNGRTRHYDKAYFANSNPKSAKLFGNRGVYRR